MAQALRETSVNLSAEIGTLDITFEDIMNFQVGNVINLGKSATDELILKVEGMPKFKGHPGFSKGNQAIKLTGAIE